MDSKYLNKVNLGYSPNWLQQHISDETISLTITSPPVYDDELYIVHDTAEFGWKSYDEYLLHLKQVMHEIYRITIPGGHVVINASSGPKENNNEILYLFPIVADITKIAIELGFIFMNEIIWVKDNYLYNGLKKANIPNSIVHQQHDQLLVFRKNGVQRLCGKKIEVSSVWHFPEKDDDPTLQKYHSHYDSFPSALLRQIMYLWSCPGDIILDPYAGSGQVVKIAIEEKRIGIGVEVDSRWIISK